MDITVEPGGTVEWNGTLMACALGANGVTNAKREGDRARRIAFSRERSGAARRTAMPR